MDFMVMGPNAVLAVIEHKKGNWILNGGFFTLFIISVHFSIFLCLFFNSLFLSCSFTSLCFNFFIFINPLAFLIPVSSFPQP